MPRANTFGSCDPYIVVDFGARRDTVAQQLLFRPLVLCREDIRPILHLIDPKIILPAGRKRHVQRIEFGFKGSGPRLPIAEE